MLDRISTTIRRRGAAVAVAAGISLTAAACGGGDSGSGTPTTAQVATASPTVAIAIEATASPVATQAATPESIDFSSPSTLTDGDPEFNYSALVWQGYWLSRDQFGPLTMGSGMGLTFEPPMDAIQMAMQMVAANSDDQPWVPKNIAPLQAIYRSGDTALAQDMMTFPPDDFAGLRLDPTSFETVVGVTGQAELMLKESQWARNFHQDDHFGTPESDFGAQQRFTGMMVSMLAQMQGQYAMQMLMNPDDGLYYDSDGELDYRGNWVLMHAFADIAGITSDPALRYANQQTADMFAMAAANLFESLAERSVADPQEGASAIRALAYLAWTTTDDQLRSAALGRLQSIAGELETMQPGSPAEHGALIAGLVASADAQGTATSPAVHESWSALVDDFNPQTGVFEGTSIYTTDDVAWLIGGMNALAQAGPPELKAEAARVMVAFYEATMNVAGMQLSAPPGKDGAMAGEYEKDLPSVVYYHGRNTPAPPMAGGTFGRLPLPAAEITFSDGAWQVTDSRVETAGAMHLANELNWLGPHLGSIPFPPLGTNEPTAGTGASADAASEITVTASNVAFDVDSLAAPIGTEITVTFVNDDAAVPHNFHLSGPGGFDVKTAIFEGSDGGSRTISFTLTEPGNYEFVCDVHPAQMAGTLVASYQRRDNDRLDEGRVP